MQLKDLLSEASLSSDAFLPSLEIDSVTEHSSDADQNSIFVCIRGLHSNGHSYAPDAYRRGCRVFVAEEPLSLPADAIVISHSDTRAALARLSCHVFGDPSHYMRVIGITGTKGKTTVAGLLRHILQNSGISCGYIGTNGICYGDNCISTRNTTPDATTLQKALAEMLRFGCQAVVLEVSSQALLQKRIDGTVFDTCLFTNLSPDHIGEGEHSDFSEYAACKHRLFTDFHPKTVIYNADDPHANLMISGSDSSRFISFSVKGKADYCANRFTPSCRSDQIGMQFDVNGHNRCATAYLPMIGKHNTSNALSAIATAVEVFGISFQKAVLLLESARISGRSEVISLPSGALVVIDYAHNGSSLCQLLSGLSELNPKRLITLFGSVGERTRLRRRELGDVAARFSSLCILTSDNPGQENPEQIIADIAKAFERSDTPYVSIPDRREAILFALKETLPGDILVLAGKGHEQYQLIGKERLPFSEREIVESAMIAAK